MKDYTSFSPACASADGYRFHTISADDWKREIGKSRKRRAIQDAKRKAVVEKALLEKKK